MRNCFILGACILLSVSSVLSSEPLQAAWIASVLNINFPSKPGLSVETQKNEIRSLLDTAQSAGLNSVVLQVRPECDALYKSNIEPWSRFLTGTQGQNPGYDPLETFIAEGKKRGVAIHAWLNPYRAAISAKNRTRTRLHISRRLPQYVRKVDNLLWMDPGSPEVREHIITVVKDIVTRYDIAGIHFDDYFYPYPAKGKVKLFPDDALYKEFQKDGGKLRKADWRRNNVNQLIASVSKAVHSIKPDIAFGVSPFGIYSKGKPSDVKAGVDQYHQLFSDPLTWMKNGWVDYLSPQLYWSVEGPQSFRSLIKWWRDPKVNPGGVPICPGVAVVRMTSHGWSSSEIKAQLQLELSSRPRAGGGFILWNIKALQHNTKGVNEVVKQF